MNWKEVLKPNKLSIFLFVILFILVNFFFFMLPATICESLYLGDQFHLRFLWSDTDTTMRTVNLEYEKCITTSPLIFIVFYILIVYVIASFIVYWCKKGK